MALIQFLRSSFYIFCFSIFSFSVLAETSIPEIDRLDELRARFEKAGWTSNASGIGYDGENVIAETFNLYSPDYQIVISFSNLKVNDWYENAAGFSFKNLEIGHFSLVIDELPGSYGTNKPITEFEIAAFGLVATNIQFKAIDIPAFFTVAQRVPEGGTDETPANEMRAFYDGLLLYALHGGIAFKQLNARSMFLSNGRDQNQIREKFIELSATGLAKSAIDTFSAKSWKSSNNILPRSINRGAVEIKGVSFQH